MFYFPEYLSLTGHITQSNILQADIKEKVDVSCSTFFRYHFESFFYCRYMLFLFNSIAQVSNIMFT